MKINGVEFDFNATKLEGMKKLDEAMKPMMEKVVTGQNLMEQLGSLYEGAKMQIDAFRQFFIDLTGKDIVGDCDDVSLTAAFFDDFNRQVAEQRRKVKEDYFKRP